MGSFSVAWCVRWWTEDAEPRLERGTCEATARDRGAAESGVRQDLAARFDWPRRTVRVAIGDTLHGATQFVGNYPPEIPDRHALRRRVAGGTPPDSLRQELLAAGRRPVEILQAFALAFHAEPEDALEPGEVERRRPTWERCHRLREALVHGESIADVLHELYVSASTLDLFVAMRDGLDLEFNDAKVLVDLACERHWTFDRELDLAIQRRRSVPGG